MLYQKSGMHFAAVSFLPLRRLVAAALLAGLPAAARAGEPTPRPVNVVLVHGILNTGKIFTPFIQGLEAAGYRCYAPTLSPKTGLHGIHDLAVKLSAQIDRHFGRDEPVFLIGFSMGGLVTREYVQTLAAPKRVRGVFLISAPNHGTFWACLYPRKDGIGDMALDSPFLKRLNADTAAWREIPVSSYWTPYDLMILPARSSVWPVGETMRVSCPLHPRMVKNRVVIADVTAKIKTIARSPAERRAAAKRGAIILRAER